MIDQEIRPNAVYTTKETQVLLKVSNSTMKRMVKKGMIRANKVGGQYRFLGRELLRVISPAVEKRAIHWYRGVKKTIGDKIRDW